MGNERSSAGPQADNAQAQVQLGRRLREAREYLGLSQEFVGEQLSVSRAAVSAMETARRKVSALELKRLAALYRCSVGQLLEDTPETADSSQDPTVRALFRTTRALTGEDQEQVLRFAQFLRHGGSPGQARQPQRPQDEEE